MSERDELEQFIADATYRPMPGERAMNRLRVADRLLAAGYRKPRTVTTAEELDALARGAVVLSDVYISNHGQAISFQRWEDGAWHRGARSASTHPDNFLPATVLYEPTV